MTFEKMTFVNEILYFFVHRQIVVAFPWWHSFRLLTWVSKFTRIARDVRKSLLFKGHSLFLWNSISLYPCATAELGKTFLPETTNELQRDIECPYQTFHSITKVLEIAGDEEQLQVGTRWCDSRPSRWQLKQQHRHTMLPAELCSEGWWAAYYHIPLLRILKILPQNLACFPSWQVYHPWQCREDYSDLTPCACNYS